MKIALYCRHEGLIRVLKDLWEDHSVEVTGESKSDIYKEADITVSTIWFQDLEHIRTERPVIAYSTNALSALSYAGLGYWLQRPNFAVVGAIPDYREDGAPNKFIPQDYVIRYALKNYPKHQGGIHKILVVNRKANPRLGDITLSYWGKSSTVEDLLGDRPFEIADTGNHEDLKNMYRDYDMAFYFSNNPMTIVMHEIMEVGIPCVALSMAFLRVTGYIDRCFGEYSVKTREEMEKKIDLVFNSGEAMEYPENTQFEEVKGQWNNLFDNLYSRYGHRGLVL
jgi:hypothetical protein